DGNGPADVLGRPVTAARVVELTESCVSTTAQFAVGGPCSGESAGAFDALRFPLDGATVVHFSVGAQHLSARWLVDVSVCACDACGEYGQRECCRSTDGDCCSGG